MSSSELIQLLQRAQAIALYRHGVPNILQPGIIKELMMAEVLGHSLIPQKDSADAMDADGNSCEYLASIRRVNVVTNKGCSFQMDRVTPSNMHRVTRNKSFYFGIFKDHLEIDEIWIVDSTIILNEVKRQLDKCVNDIAHINFLLKWLLMNGKCIYRNFAQQGDAPESVTGLV